MTSERTWTGRIQAAGGKTFVALPFDPVEAWGERDRYDLAGLVGGHAWRGKAVRYGEAWGLPLGPAWLKGAGLAPGSEVQATVALEGPQIETLPDDVRCALLADEEATRRFNGMTTHCRKNYMRWIDEAKRPETRANRIAEMVRMVRAGEER